MQKDSKLIAEAYFKKVNEETGPVNINWGGESVPKADSPFDNNSDRMSVMQKILNGEQVSPMILSKLSREELLIILTDISKKLSSKDQDDESSDKTEQDPNDKSSIDYAREDRAAAERDKWTQGQGVGGKFHF